MVVNSEGIEAKYHIEGDLYAIAKAFQNAMSEQQQSEGTHEQKIADALATALAEASGKHSEEILQLQQ